MKRLACVLSVVALVVASGLAGAQDENSPTIKVVMQKLHKGANSPLAKLKTALKSNSPDWKSIQDASKDFVILGAGLAKNDPPQGEKSNYKKLAEAYYENAKAMDDAAKAENKQACQAAFTKVSTSCMACHKAHRPS